MSSLDNFLTSKQTEYEIVKLCPVQSKSLCSYCGRVDEDVKDMYINSFNKEVKVTLCSSCLTILNSRLSNYLIENERQKVLAMQESYG